jgi:hypothetical protein
MQIESDVSYDPVTDRLVGGDFTRELGNGWVRSFLMPAQTAERLLSRLQQLDETFRAEHAIGDGGSVPYPRVVTIIRPGGLPGAIDGQPQLVPLDLAFAAPQLHMAPAVYHDLVQLVCLVDSPTTLADQQPDTARGRREFVVNLFGVLRCVHRLLHLALTVGIRSSIEPRGVSPAGHLQDPYFLVGPGDVPGIELHRGQHDDIARALTLIAAWSRSDKGIAVSEAAKTYWQTQTLPPTIADLCDRVASGPDYIPQDVEILAGALISGGW